MLEGKVVIVTGAARGLGQEYVKAIVGAGGRAVATDRASCAETLELVAGTPGRAIGCEVDVTSMASVQAMADAAVKAFGRIDGLVNNAGFYAGVHGGRFDTIDEAEWDMAMAVNVKGIWNCCKAVVPAMKQAGGGSIVNVSSLAALYGTPYVLHYTTSKAAVLGLTRGLARELGRANIRVNSLAPSAVTTEATREFFAEKYDVALKTVAAGQAIARNLTTADLAGTVLWLLSDASAFVTGQTVPVDGGTVFL
ncbi:MAG TPA: SDR family oxidoreductase [Nevskiaceae bacterium]|nr:SDR family oxidoreductase [Nevskiaceae bacterium]